MAFPNTTFISRVTVIATAWLQAVNNWIFNNEVNAAVYPGIDRTGVTDSWAALQAAATDAAGKRLYIPGGIYLISQAIDLSNYTEVYGDGRATVIKLGTPAISGFRGVNKTNVVVRDLSILGTLPTATAYTGGVFYDSTTMSKVLNVEMIGMTWGGVYLNNSSQCSIEGCRFSGWIGTVQDRADIIIYRDSNYNMVRGNHCYGGGNHGVLIQDPYTPSYPTGNIVTSNEVGEHTGNGISFYATTAYDSQTVISNNVVRDILGTDLGNQTGSGIFLQSASGVTVTGNTLSNCCRNTVNFDTQAVGAITVGLGVYGSGNTSPTVIANNHIFAQRGPGIFANTSDKSITIEGNTIRSTGTAAVRGEGILAINCSHIKIHNNTIYHLNTNYSALRVTADTSDWAYNEIVGNTISHAGGGGITLNQTGGGTTSNSLVEGNTVWSSAGGIAYVMEKSPNLRFAGNHGESTGVVFTLTNCTGTRMVGNRLYSPSGGYSIIFTGTNTDSVCDESNSLTGVIENDPANGMLISKYADSAPPGSGLWSVGDRVIRKTSALGSPKGYRCITSGNPGRWASEGDLGTEQTMECIYSNPFLDIYSPGDPTVGPPANTTTPGTAVREAVITYPGNRAAVSCRVVTGGTSIGNALVMSPSQPYRGLGPVSVTVPLYSLTASRYWVVHGWDGTSYHFIGQTSQANTWELISGTFNAVLGANWAIVVSCWDGVNYVSGFQGYIGGVNVVEGTTAAATLSSSLGRKDYTVFATVAPSLAPDFTGMWWRDTVSGLIYRAFGQTGVVDWRQLN